MVAVLDRKQCDSQAHSGGKGQVHPVLNGEVDVFRCRCEIACR